MTRAQFQRGVGDLREIIRKRSKGIKKTRGQLRKLEAKVKELGGALSLVAGHMIEGTIGDKPMLADSAALIWMIEGQRHIRVQYKSTQGLHVCVRR